MSYRRRGGLNGRGAIIRPPGYRTNGQENPHIGEENLHQMSPENNYSPNPSTMPQSAASTLNQMSNSRSVTAASTLHQSPNSVTQAATNMVHVEPQTTVRNVNLDNNGNINVSDETGNPEKTDSVLHPDELWFPHCDVVDKVSETSYKTYFKGPYCNLKMTPPQVRLRWWNAFKLEFSWDPSIAKRVKKGWQSKCRRRLSDMVSKVCTDPDYNADWCPPTIREEMVQIRSTEEFQEKSEKCKKNRKGNGNQKIHHRQGSISTEEVMLKLKKELGRKPTAAELYYKCHADGSGRFVNDKAQAVWNDFKEKKATNSLCESENQKTEDELFLEATGGWTDKGRVFGMGASADSYYERPGVEERNAKRRRRDYAMELEGKVIDLVTENLEQKTELDATKVSLVETQKSLAETQNALKALEQTVQLLLQASNIATIPTSTSSPSV
ncbi:uncharacterized protein [Spinacia oleracea]|uniref:Uncharacterized protein isoform X1 n=1 Tax=Spinacia oleracea TaxID=3562 RepID=A0ABM3RGI4_SPIOL|nr:uncharacterized protein LOC110778237 isoform X1 [Spinacia oleracea]